MSFIKEDNSVTVIVDSEIPIDDVAQLSDSLKKCLINSEQLTVVSIKELEKCAKSSYDAIISVFKRSCTTTEIFLEECLRMLKPKGTLIIYESFQEEDNAISVYDKRASSLKLAGFKVKEQRDLDTQEFKNQLLNIYNDVNNICETVAEKPSFEIGSSVTLNFGEKKSSNVWKLDDALDEELINEDDLLDESDIIKPSAAALRVCGTTGKRKACKDCTCGLAEELSGKTPSEDTVKSSCGNCYLGDAFRCASCPYLGMPAFKPGEKVVLPDSQLKAD